MPQKAANISEDASTGGLGDFTFDNLSNEDFFNIGESSEKAKKGSIETVIKEVSTDDEDDDDFVEKQVGKGESKKKANSTKNAQEDDAEIQTDEEDENNDFFDINEGKESKGEKATKDKKEVAKPEQKPAQEEEDDNSEEDDDEDDKKKPVTKAKADAKNVSPEEPDEVFYKTLASELKEKGIFQNVEIKDEEDITEEKFFELQDAEIEARVEETFQAFAEDLDEDGKAFIKHLKAGGKPRDFISVYTQSPLPDLDNFDSGNATHRELVISTYLQLVENMDAEEIKDRITWLKEGGKDKSYAEKYWTKLEQIDEKQKKGVVEAAQAAQAKKESNTKAFVKNIGEAINKADTIKGFKITKEDKKVILDIITKPSVKIDKNKYIPKFNQKLGAILNPKTEEDLSRLILLAKLVESDFDTKDVATKAETKVAKTVQSKLRDAKNGVKPSSSGQYAKKSLGDYF